MPDAADSARRCWRPERYRTGRAGNWPRWNQCRFRSEATARIAAAPSYRPRTHTMGSGRRSCSALPCRSSTRLRTCKCDCRAPSSTTRHPSPSHRSRPGGSPGRRGPPCHPRCCRQCRRSAETRFRALPRCRASVLSKPELGAAPYPDSRGGSRPRPNEAIAWATVFDRSSRAPSSPGCTGAARGTARPAIRPRRSTYRWLASSNSRKA